MINNKLTLNSLLKRTKRKLGISTLPLPITDDDYIEVLAEETLPLFSMYFPRYISKKIDIESLECSRESTYFAKRYILPKEITDNFNIIDISKIEYMDNPIDFMYPDCESSLNCFDYAIDAFAAQTINTVVNLPIPHRFESPNILYMHDTSNVFNCAYLITFLVCHNIDLSTVPFTGYGLLQQLFMYDVQIEFYQDMKRMDKINTTFGTIDLKIDNWEAAPDLRKELLEKFDKMFLTSRRDNIKIT